MLDDLILQATEVPEGYRDLGVPQAEGEKSRLACDPTFNRYASYWLLGETLDSTEAALEGLSRTPGAGARDLVREQIEKLPSVLGRHHDPESGVFRADGSARTSGIGACHAALGVLKSVTVSSAGDEPGSEAVLTRPLGADRFDAWMTDFGLAPRSAPPHRKVLDLLADRAAASPVPGAFLDSPSASTPPTLTVLYIACSVVWNLAGRDAAGTFFELVEEWACRKFIDGCIRQSRASDLEIAGFTVHPASDEICANTTFFGLKLLDRLGLAALSIDRRLHRGIVNFLLHVVFRDGGFSSTVREGPSLNATFFSLRALRRLLGEGAYVQWLNGVAPRIRDFVERCSHANGGGRFAPDAGRYVENCLATRYRVQILTELERVAPGTAPAAEWAEPTARFYAAQRCDGASGFEGYAQGRYRVDQPELGAWLEGYLSRRDRAVAEAYSDPDFELDLEIDRCHARLAVLTGPGSEEGLERSEVAETVQRLRGLQAQEAARLRQAAEASLAMPVRQMLDAT